MAATSDSTVQQQKDTSDSNQIANSQQQNASNSAMDAARAQADPTIWNSTPLDATATNVATEGKSSLFQDTTLPAGMGAMGSADATGRRTPDPMHQYMNDLSSIMNNSASLLGNIGDMINAGGANPLADMQKLETDGLSTAQSVLKLDSDALQQFGQMNGSNTIAGAGEQGVGNDQGAGNDQGGMHQTGGGSHGGCGSDSGAERQNSGSAGGTGDQGANGGSGGSSEGTSGSGTSGGTNGGSDGQMGNGTSTAGSDGGTTTAPPTDGSGGATTAPPTDGSGGATTAPPTDGSGGATTAPPTDGSGGATTAPPTDGSGGATTAPPTDGSGGATTAPPTDGSGTTTVPPTDGSGATTTAPPTDGSGATTTAPPTDGSGATTTAPPTDGSGATTTAPPTDGSGATTTAPPTDGNGTTTVPPADGSGFIIQNGQLTVNGQLLNGVAVTGEYAQQVGATALANQISQDFPGINVVRLATSPDGGAFTTGQEDNNGGETIDNINQTITALNAKGIGVIIDNHDSDANTPNNVSLDGNEPAWFSQIAQDNLGNNMVMYQSENEPMGDPNAVTAEQQAVYNAVRGTGSNSVVAFDMIGGGDASAFQQNASTYDQDSNYVIDAHAYASTNPDPGSALQQEIASVGGLTEANGSKVPVYIGETGNSIDGSNIDPAQQQLLQDVWTDGTGGVAWLFDGAATGYGSGNGADMMTDSSGNLTGYGDEIAGLVAQGAT